MPGAVLIAGVKQPIRSFADEARDAEHRHDWLEAYRCWGIAYSCHPGHYRPGGMTEQDEAELCEYRRNEYRMADIVDQNAT